MCPLCGNGQGRPCFQAPIDIYSRAMGRSSGTRFSYCERCSVLFQEPLISEEDYARLYEEVQRGDDVGFDSNSVPTWHVEKKVRDAGFKWAAFERLNLESLLPGKRVVEIGPGEGTLLATFRDRGYTCWGIEPLELYARYARDVMHLDVADGYFNDETHFEANLVILDNVLEHLRQPLDSLKAIRKRLDVGGMLIILVPNAETPALCNPVVGHVTLWSRSALEWALEQAGFEAVDIVPGRPAARPHEWIALARAVDRPPVSVKLATYESLGRPWQRFYRRVRMKNVMKRVLGPLYEPIRSAVRP